jgi:hypothetical protein
MESATRNHDQMLLAVVDAQGCCNVLKAIGQPASDLFDQVGGDREALGFDEDDRPTGFGLHVWVGHVVLGCHGNPERGEAAPYNDEWRGEWRRAAMDDLYRFGFPIPADRTLTSSGS